MYTHYLYAVIWLLLAVGFGYAETVTFELVAIWFAVGAVVSMIAALMGASLSVQFWCFLISAIVLLAATRPFLKRFVKTRKERTNADQVIGTIAIVTEDIDNAEARGRVKASGLSWSARSEDGAPIAAGEQVLVKSIEGVKLIVEPLV